MKNWYWRIVLVLNSVLSLYTNTYLRVRAVRQACCIFPSTELIWFEGTIALDCKTVFRWYLLSDTSRTEIWILTANDELKWFDYYEPRVCALLCIVFGRRILCVTNHSLISKVRISSFSLFWTKFDFPDTFGLFVWKILCL